MRTYRPWIVLAAFIAVGVGLAVGVALSVAPETTESGGPVASSSAVGPDGPAAAAIRVLPRPQSNHASHGGSVAGGGFVADASVPAYAAPYPALAARQAASDETPSDQPQAGPSLSSEPEAAKAVVPGPLVEALLGASGATGAVEPLPPPVSPAAGAPAAEALQNHIRRTRGAQGDRFTINILDADIREVLGLLSKEGPLNILASPKVEGKVSASLSGVDLNGALEAILKSTGYVSRQEGQYIFVGTPEDFVQMARAADQIATRVYHPSYVTAAELKTLITPILTEGIGVTSVTTAAASGIDAGAGSGAGNSYAGGDALLVRDYEAVLQEVDRLVAEIDLRPLQVHIEAMILSVKLDDSYKFGVNFQLLRQFDDMRLGWGTMPDSLTDWEFAGGLKFGFLDKTLGSFINALEEVGDTNVIATPRLVVLNKHAAEVQIGKSLGYVNTTQTETAATQTVEFLELGTLLRIRPFVSNDGMIRLEIHPEISDGEVDVKEGLTVPRKDITQVTTNVIVRDGCTAVIGGLIQEQQEGDRKQIPLLGSLPVVGIAFREKEETLTRHELIILVTPRVVWEREAYDEGARQACEFQRRQSVYAEKMSPIGKRSVARKYVRRAKAAWAAGEQQEALRLAELAVHFDPVNREAIEIRSDIWLGKPYASSGPRPEGGTAAGAALDGPEVAPWVLEQLGQPSAAANSPPGEVLPGTPPSAAGDPGLPGDVTVLPTPPAESPLTSVPLSASPPSP